MQTQYLLQNAIYGWSNLCILGYFCMVSGRNDLSTAASFVFVNPGRRILKQEELKQCRDQ